MFSCWAVRKKEDAVTEQEADNEQRQAKKENPKMNMENHFWTKKPPKRLKSISKKFFQTNRSRERDEHLETGCCSGCLVALALPFAQCAIHSMLDILESFPTKVDTQQTMNYNPILTSSS